LTWRNHALELRIFERMVLRPYGQALVRRVHRGPIRYCPGCQDAICGQPKIIVKPTGIVLLNDKVSAAATSPHSPGWFGCFGKGSLASICCERHLLPSTVCSFVGGSGIRLIAHHPSRTTSSGRLSFRRPRNRGCRSLPPAVHSLNRIWATSFGFTQCTWVLGTMRA
jgi:hypothetical protein